MLCMALTLTIVFASYGRAASGDLKGRGSSIVAVAGGIVLAALVTALVRRRRHTAGQRLVSE